MRQYDVDSERLVAAGLNEPWVSRAKRCGYCGLYYSVDDEESETTVKPRGWFDGNELMAKENWRPSENRVPRRIRP